MSYKPTMKYPQQSSRLSLICYVNHSRRKKTTFYIATGIYFQESKIKVNKKNIENMKMLYIYIYNLHVWLVVSDILVSKDCRSSTTPIGELFSSVKVVEHYTKSI